MGLEDRLAQLSEDATPAEEKDERVLNALELMDTFEDDIKKDVTFEEAVDKLIKELGVLKESKETPEQENSETPEEEGKEKAEGIEKKDEEEVPLNVPPLTQTF